MSLFTKNEWIMILKLSTRWFFQDIRDFALEHLDKEDTGSASEKVYLGQLYFIPRWIHEGLSHLVNSKMFIDINMTRWLGEATVIRLYQCRGTILFRIGSLTAT